MARTRTVGIYYIKDVKLIPPCNIGKNVIIENSTIGPNVAIGDNSIIKNKRMKDTFSCFKVTNNP